MEFPESTGFLYLNPSAIIEAEVIVLKQKLWTKNFVLVTLASALGSAGAIAGGFALSIFVFDETGSTLAAALIAAIQFVPFVFIPLIAAPLMDRLPRKAFLVGGDMANGLIYTLMGVWLLYLPFSYTGYLAVSLLLSCLGAIDELAYTGIYPDLIEKGAEQKGYAVSSMLYPVLRVLMTPLAAVMLDALGVAILLLLQGALSFAAALTESFIRLDESAKRIRERYSLRAWAQDIREAFVYLKQERELRSIFEYMAVTNGVASGYGPVLVAFFRTAPGFSAAMYSLFSGAEFLGRTLGSFVQYRVKIPPKKRHGFVFFVYQVYETMDMCLLWLPYPLMLINRGLCGFLGSNSAILREAAVQRYLSERLRSRINAFNNAMLTAAGSVLSLLIGALGEVMDYRLCMTLCGGAAMLACWLLIGGRGKHVRSVYEVSPEQKDAAETAESFSR